ELGFADRIALFGKIDAEQIEAGKLSDIGLGGCHRYLYTAFGYDQVLGNLGKMRVRSVCDTKGIRTLLLSFFYSSQRVGGFAGLGDSHSKGSLIDEKLASSDFGGDFDIHRQRAELLDDAFTYESGMISGTTS